MKINAVLLTNDVTGLQQVRGLLRASKHLELNVTCRDLFEASQLLQGRAPEVLLLLNGSAAAFATQLPVKSNGPSS